MPDRETPDAIEIEDVSKRFGATVALDGAHLAIRRGEVHALIGENGAGKSTVVKLLSGLVRPDRGTIRLHGRQAMIPSPRAAHTLGIQTAFQELSLIADLTIRQNMLLPYEPVTSVGQIRRRWAERQVREILARFGLEFLDPAMEAGELDLPLRQKIEIVKAVARKPRILLLDEPTSTFSRGDVDWLGRIIVQLKADGITVVFITHRLPEVRMFCDALSVLRNGKQVGTFRCREVSDDDIIRLMLGHRLASSVPTRGDRQILREGAPALAARGIATDGRLRDASLELWPGEILGVAALQGMGQHDLFRAFFGMAKLTKGRIEINGRPVTLASPKDALRGNVAIGLLPEDRKQEALFLRLSGRANVSLPVLGRFSRLGCIAANRETRAVDQVLDRINVHPSALYRLCSAFSGGNQQKIALAKWLLAESRVLLLYDPTRGVDVGTKHEIYRAMDDFAKRGGAVLFYSSEIGELINMCDRVVVLFNGRVAQVVTGPKVDEETIIRVALGQPDPAPRTDAPSAAR
jgi:ribose transport system ATP-binding protein